MIALVILLALGLWVGLGVWIWKHVLRRVLADPVLLLLGTLLFAAVWLLAPWADEYLGQKEFARLCAAMPDTQFLGPDSKKNGLIANAITGTKVGEFVRESLPLYAALIVALLLVTFVPAVSTWLPNL